MFSSRPAAWAPPTTATVCPPPPSPAALRACPVEAIETAAPLLMRRRELRPDSGGAGQFRGGLGQEMEMEIITGMNANHSCMYDRTGNAAAGLLGGSPAPAARLRSPMAGGRIPNRIMSCGPGSA